MSDAVTDKELTKFYNRNAEVLDQVLMPTGKDWQDLTHDERKRLYFQYGGKS